MAEPAFWDKPERAREVVQRVKTLKVVTEPYDRLIAQLQSATELDELFARAHPPTIPTAAVRRPRPGTLSGG